MQGKWLQVVKEGAAIPAGWIKETTTVEPVDIAKSLKPNQELISTKEISQQGTIRDDTDLYKAPGKNEKISNVYGFTGILIKNSCIIKTEISTGAFEEGEYVEIFTNNPDGADYGWISKTDYDEIQTDYRKEPYVSGYTGKAGAKENAVSYDEPNTTGTSYPIHPGEVSPIDKKAILADGTIMYDSALWGWVKSTDILFINS